MSLNFLYHIILICKFVYLIITFINPILHINTCNYQLYSLIQIIIKFLQVTFICTRIKTKLLFEMIQVNQWTEQMLKAHLT